MVKLKAKRVVPYKEAEGKLEPFWFDYEDKLWIELEDGKIIIVRKDVVEGVE